jgi:hypothetical protein
MLVMGALSLLPVSEPRNGAEPNAKTPPSDAASQYPESVPFPAMPTTGSFSETTSHLQMRRPRHQRLRASSPCHPA